MAHQNVLYIEPNYVESWSDDNITITDEYGNVINNGVHELAPKLEDYCVAIDLEVEVTERSNGSFGMSDTHKILFSWSTTKGSASFNSGTDFNNTKDGSEPRIVKSINYLSTAPTEYGTYSDMLKYGTKECFGINSIDISYNNYAVPEVTINFTDIRGMSLFGEEELRHSGVNDKGVDGFARPDIASSFFKCFFSFPYPKFKLMVKGFYGEPTTYELCCADFRASFDCRTGNFGATARFVGYAYSMLNDITMNALVAAPYCEYVGKEYWEKKTNSIFVVDGKKMPTFIDIIKKIKDIKVDISRTSNDSEISIEAKKYDDEGIYLNNVIETYKDYFEYLIEKLNELKIENDDMNPLCNRKTFSFILFNITDKINESFNFDELNTKYSRFEASLQEYNNNYGNKIIAPRKFDKFSFISISDNDLQTKLKKSEYFNTYNAKINDKGYKYAQFYDNSSFAEIIDRLHKENQNNVNKVQQKLSEQIDEVVNNHLGFQPTIENITSILMAHLDTLIHCIYYCSNEVNKIKRKAKELGLDVSDVKYKDSIVPPFPKVAWDINTNGITKHEEGWMADLIGGGNQPEVNFVEGLLDATNNIAKTINECASELENANGYAENILKMKIPLTPLDIVCNSKPFGEEIEYSTPSDFIGKLGIRMFNLFGTNLICNDYSQMGIADAINFASTMPTPNERFLAMLKNGIFNSDVILDSLLNKNTNDVKDLKINKSYWKWDIHSDIASVNMYKRVNKHYELNLYKIGGTQVLPIKNIEWNTIKSDLSNDSLPSSNEYLYDRYDDIKDTCDILFKIDTDYLKYSKYQASMKVNDKELSYVDDLGLNYSLEDYVEDFYDDDERFCSYFGDNDAVSGKNFVTYACGENSYLLPRYLPTFEEVKNSKSFNNGKGYKSFNSIINYYEPNKKNTIYKNNSKRISTCYNEIDNIESYTYKVFLGIKNGGIVTDYSLFGQKEYYQQGYNEAKALIFLDSLKACDTLWFDKFTDMGGYDVEKVINEITDNSKHFSTLPYCAVLLCGAYLYRYEKYNNENIEIITFSDNIVKRNINEAIVFGENINEKLFSLQSPIKNSLIKEFTNWVKNGFKLIQDAFELKTTSNISVIDFIDEFGDIMDKCDYDFKEINNFIKSKNYYNIEHYLSRNLSHTFYENYISFVGGEKNIKLYNRETSLNVKKFVNLFMKPCMVVKTTNFNLKRENQTFTVNNDVKKYLNSFLTELKKQYENLSVEEVRRVNVRPIDTDKNIKICLYKYLKTLWDKWLSGDEENFWSYDEFYAKNWYFIDSFYNRIGQLAKLNIIDFSSDIIYSQKEYSYSLLSFISKAYAKGNFGFYTVQNFLDMCDNEVAVNNIKNMFKPIPYESINFPELKKHPSFVILYTYEFSSKLNMDDSIYNNDSYDIGTDDHSKLPKPITNKTSLNGYKIPAFGVSFGKQYQSYFKDINVSMDSPMVTEHALKAQFEIASMHGEKGENGKNVTILGQDLYTIYANNSYTCTVRMMGCAWVQPLMCFNLLNIPLFRGTYLIQKVQHSIKPGHMETVFVGTRMSATSQHFLEKSFFSKTNNEVMPNEPKENIEYMIADITNDCKYKFFNPLVNCEPPLSEDELEMSVDEYIKKNNFNLPNDTSLTPFLNDKMVHFLAGVAQKEANNQNQLGVDMVVNVLFNRFMYYGKDITQMFRGKQHEVGVNKDENSKFVKSVRKIFTNYPLDLIGQKTNIAKSIPTYNKNEFIGNSSPKELTEDDVKKMDGYCTTPGYDINDKTTKPSESKEGWWRTKGEYIAQHDTSESALGHVFVGGFQEYGKKHWDKVEIKKKSTTSKVSNEAEGLFNAIKQTIDTSSVLNITDLKLIETKTNDNDIFYITCNPLSGLCNVFDIIVNTYYDYITEVGWLVKNDGKETPYKVKVKVKSEKNDTQNKKIVIAKLNNDETLNVLNQYENLNDNFYRVLKKKYGETIDNRNDKSFNLDCSNFKGLFASRPKDWQIVVSNLLGLHSISSCGDSINYVTSSGYTWDGDSSIQNGYKPSGKFDEYNSSSVISWLISNEQPKSLHKCASYVRQAMQKGSSSAEKIINESRPMSACVYAKFLPIWGFKEVYSGFGKEMNNYSPINGDIAVIAGKVDGINSHLHGHIQICCNDGWYSDYKCDTPWCYGDEGRPFKIFRWNS